LGEGQSNTTTVILSI